MLEERPDETGEPFRRVLLVVAPRDQVEPYATSRPRPDSGSQASISRRSACCAPSSSLSRSRVRTVDDTATVVVAIGHESSTLLVSGGGVCEFTRVFDWGGWTLQDAIAQELEVHPAEAATILRHLSLSGLALASRGPRRRRRANRALEAVRLRLTPFARELVSSLQFYQTQPESLGIGEIVITGGTSHLDGLGDALHQMIGVSVRVGDPLQRLRSTQGRRVRFEQSIGSIAVPIGLAIDDDPVRSVDLPPRDIVSQRRRPKLAPILIPVAAAVPARSARALLLAGTRRGQHRQSQLSSLQSTLGGAAAADQAADRRRRSKASRRRGRPQLRRFWQVASSGTACSDDLSRVLPANVWLTGLKAAVSTPLSTAPASPRPRRSDHHGCADDSRCPGRADRRDDHRLHVHASRRRRPSRPPRRLAFAHQRSARLGDPSTVGKKDVVQFTILANLRGVGGGA